MQRISANQLLQILSGMIELRNAAHLRMVDERFTDHYHAALDRVGDDAAEWAADCRRIGLPATAAGLDRAQAALKVDGPLFVRTRLDELRSIFQAETAGLTLLALQGQALNVDDEAPFGIEV